MKRAIVFGASGGIGQAICEDLAAEGWSLYLHFNHQKDATEKLAKTLFHEYPEQDFMTIKFDFLSSSNQMKEFVDSLLPINAAIFAQGITDYGFLSGQDDTVVEKIIQLNLTSPILLTKYLEPRLVKHDFSRIVYLGSIYGQVGSALEAVYSATKAGLTRFSQAYSREVASTGLTVNVLAPGAVDTAMNHIFSEETLQEVKDEIPLGRLAQAKDVSYWIKVLLSKDSAYCTGQTIYVTGGWLI